MPQREKILMVFQNNAMFCGTNNAYLRLMKAFKGKHDFYFAMTTKRDLYETALTEPELEKTEIIIPNDCFLNKIKRYFDLLKIIKKYNVSIIIHSYNYDVPLMFLLKIVTKVKLIYYFGSDRLSWKFRFMSYVYNKIIVHSKEVINKSVVRERKLEFLPFRNNIFAVIDICMFYVEKMPVISDRCIGAGSGLTIGFMGRIGFYNKGLIELVEAVRILNESGVDVRLLIKGDVVNPTSKEKDLLIEHARKNGVGDKLTIIPPSYSPDEKRAFFESIDVFCIPSYMEGGPIVAYEAISHLVPVIATRVGTLKNNFTHGKELLFVDMKNSKDIADKVVQLVGDPSLQLNLRNGMRQFIESIESGSIKESYSSLFDL